MWIFFDLLFYEYCDYVWFVFYVLVDVFELVVVVFVEYGG